MSASIFDYPEVYDAILCHSDEVVKAEVATIVDLMERHGMTLGRVLDLACGTGVHAVELAQKGIEVVGLDASVAMVEASQRRAKRCDVELKVVEGDVVDFDVGGDFDAAIFMSETFPIIHRYQDLVSHFASVRRALRPKGLYIVDVDAHRHGGVGIDYERWGDRTVQIGDLQVAIWHESFPGNWVEGTGRLVMHTRITDGDKTITTRDDWTGRKDAPWHLDLLVRTLAGWSLSGFCSWRDAAGDIADEDHYFMVVQSV